MIKRRYVVMSDPAHGSAYWRGPSYPPAWGLTAWSTNPGFAYTWPTKVSASEAWRTTGRPMEEVAVKAIAPGEFVPWKNP